MRNKLLAFLAFLFIQSCGHTPNSYKATEGNTAYLVGSISIMTQGASKNPFSSSDLHVRKLGELENFRISHDVRMFKSKYYQSHKDSNKVSFRIPLSSGEYEIFDISFLFDNKLSKYIYSTVNKISVPLSLENGKTYYLGDIVAHGLNVKTDSGIYHSMGGYFVVADEFDTDIQLLDSKYKGIQKNEFVNLSKNLVAAPYVFLKDSHYLPIGFMEKTLVSQFSRPDAISDSIRLPTISPTR